MTAPAAELQRAVFAELRGNAALLAALGGERIVEQPSSANAVFPYIGYGCTGIYDWSTGGEKDCRDSRNSDRLHLDFAPSLVYRVPPYP